MIQILRATFFVTFGIIGLSIGAIAQTSENPNGPRFVQPPGDIEPSPTALAQEKRCDVIGQNVTFCPGESGWVREAYPISRPGEFYQNLYQLSETQRAAVTAIFMREGESREVSYAQLESFAVEYTFESGPRGRMAIETIIEDWPLEPDQPRRRRIAIVVDQNWDRYLLTVDVYKAHYGFAIQETTVLLPEGLGVNDINQTYFSLHHDFDLLTGYKFSAG